MKIIILLLTAVFFSCDLTTQPIEKNTEVIEKISTNLVYKTVTNENYKIITNDIYPPLVRVNFKNTQHRMKLILASISDNKESEFYLLSSSDGLNSNRYTSYSAMNENNKYVFYYITWDANSNDWFNWYYEDYFYTKTEPDLYFSFSNNTKYTIYVDDIAFPAVVTTIKKGE